MILLVFSLGSYLCSLVSFLQNQVHSKNSLLKLEITLKVFHYMLAKLSSSRHSWYIGIKIDRTETRESQIYILSQECKTSR